MENEPLVVVKNLKKHFRVKDGTVFALEDVSFEVFKGETLGIVGESGCGKSTLGKTLLQLGAPTSGEIYYAGANVLAFDKGELKDFRKKAQMIFQDPYSSLNPRMNVRDIIEEPLKVQGINIEKNHVERLLELVGLSPLFMQRYPHEFSGGQRQRIGIARALAMNPEFIVCDEPISALDVSIQAQIINLLKKLQKEMGLTYLFISHDLSLVKYLSTRVAVMYLGHIVELSTSEKIYANPKHPYTQALLSAIPIANPQKERERKKILLEGDIPSPINPPKGCVFCTRCPFAEERCHKERPLQKEIEPGHTVSCHLA